MKKFKEILEIIGIILMVIMSFFFIASFGLHGVGIISGQTALILMYCGVGSFLLSWGIMTFVFHD